MSNAGYGSKNIKILEPNGYEEEPENILVRVMRSGIIKITGKVTGKEYIFNGGGSVVGIDKRDIEIINKYNVITASCCGSLSSPYFEFV